MITRGLNDGPFTVEVCPHGCSDPTGCDICMAPAQYPEHEKFKAVAEKSQACGEFLEWLRERYPLGKYHVHTVDCGKPDEWGSRRCGMIQHGLYPEPVNVQKLLAEFFAIDEDKLEKEKLAMLEELRKGRG